MSVRLGEKVQALPRCRRLSEGVAAAVFYCSVAALTGGVIRALRASVERRVRDRAGILLAVGGVCGLIASVALFLSGQKTLLPF